MAPLDEIESGKHLCQLTKIKDCKIPKWKKVGESYEKDGERDGVRFVFKVHNKNAYICKAVGNSTNEKGALYKMLQMLYNAFDLGLTFGAHGVCKDASEFEKKLSALTNKWFTVDCERNGKFTNFVSAKPAEAPKVGEQPTGFEGYADAKGIEGMPDHDGTVDLAGDDVDYDSDALPF